MLDAPTRNEQSELFSLANVDDVSEALKLPLRGTGDNFPPESPDTQATAVSHKVSVAGHDTC